MGLFFRAIDKAGEKMKGEKSVRLTVDELAGKLQEWFIDATKEQTYLESVKKTAKGAGVFDEYGIKEIDSPDGRYTLVVDIWDGTILPRLIDPLWHALFPSRSVYIKDKEEKINYRLDKEKNCKKFYKAVVNLIDSTAQQE